MNKSSTNQKQATMKKLLQSLKTNIWFRFFLLILSAAAGIVLLVVFTNYCENDPRMFSKLCQGSRFTASFKIILLGLPVFILLWWYRTLDIKEQLAKSEEQINQNNYFQGLDNLVSNETLKVEIGVQQLLELSKVVKKYKDDIKLAFIERLKSPLKKKEGKVIYFSYAQYIVDWLSENYYSTGLDLSDCNFDYQEFKIETNFNIFKKKKNSSERLSFAGAYLVEVNLNNAYLVEVNLNNANLNNANLNKAILHKAILHKAILHKANLRGADLLGADLSNADLRESNLSKAYLNESNLSNAYLNEAHLVESNLHKADLIKANLSKAYLSETNLSETKLYITNLEDSSFKKDQPPLDADLEADFEKWGYKKVAFVKNGTDFYRLVKDPNYL